MKVLEQERFQNLTHLKKSEVKEIFDEVSENIEDKTDSYKKLFMPRFREKRLKLFFIIHFWASMASRTKIRGHQRHDQTTALAV